MLLGKLFQLLGEGGGDGDGTEVGWFGRTTGFVNGVDIEQWNASSTREIHRVRKELRMKRRAWSIASKHGLRIRMLTPSERVAKGLFIKNRTDRRD